ncbi:MAG: hypothetical protein Q8M08_02370 [Bacteroidales bacterium]|nr:hypothetical protein [Bacteroidales bacterium]
MKDKVQVKISQNGSISTNIIDFENEEGQSLLNNLRIEYINKLILSGKLIKNEIESNESEDVYDLIY